MFFAAKDKIELKIGGMTCGHCETKIEQAVQGLSGIRHAEASLLNNTVTIIPEKGRPFNLEQVKEEIVKLGYQVLE